MNDEFTSNNIENPKSFLNTGESDYQSLISRLKEIKTTIAILEKTIFR